MLTRMILVMILLSSSFLAISQPYIEMLRTPERYTFKEMVDATEEYFRLNPERKKGAKSILTGSEFEGAYNKFKRWEWNTESRINPEGKVFNYVAHNLEEYEKQKSEFRSSNVMPLAANWQFEGPTSYVLKSGGYNGGVGRVNCIAFHPSSVSTFWIGTPGGGLWRTTDHGATWTVLTDNLTANLGVSGIAVNPNDTNNIYILTGDGDAESGLPSSGVYKTTDGGQSWNAAGLNWNRNQLVKGRKILMHPTNPSILYVVSSKGVHKSVNGGVNWVLMKTGNFYDIEFKPDNPSIMYACNNIDFFRSVNGGDTWLKVTSGLVSSDSLSRRLAIAVTPLRPSQVYVVNGGKSGGADFLGVFKSPNNGQTFTPQSVAPNILGYNNDGSDNKSQTAYDLAILASNITDNLIAVGGINIWSSADGGVNWGTSKTQWYEQTAPAGQYVHADIHALEVNPLNNFWYTGTDGGIYYSTDNGNTWSSLSSGLSLQQIFRVSGKDASAGGMYVGTQDNGINGLLGSQAQHVMGADGMEVHAVSGTVYAAIQSGNSIYKYSGNPITGPNTWVDIHPASNGRFVIPFELHPTNTNTLYAAYNRIWETTNQGASWDSLPGSRLTNGKYSAMEISPTNPERIYAASDNGKIYRRDVAGETWTNITSPLFPTSNSNFITGIAISRDPSTNGLTAWVAFSGYTAGKKVFKTTNGGITWTNVSAGLPNVPVNCILFDSVHGQSVNALYVGTDLGVYYRNDVLGTWQPYNTGLPVIRVNDLEIIASENMIYAGTFGRGLWKSPLNKPCLQAKITVAAGDTTMCIGSAVGLQAYPPGASSYLWSNGETTESIVTSIPGDYKVTVTASGCPPSTSNQVKATEYGGSAAGVIEWQNTLGGSLTEELFSVNQTTDGGYILGGESWSDISGDKTENSRGNTDYWVVKLDVSGNIEWDKTIGGDESDELKSVRQTADGGYIIGGNSYSNASGDKTENSIGDMDFWIVKIDSAGAVQWQNTIGGNGFDELNELQQTSDGGYILGGYSSSDISGDKTEDAMGNGDYWIVKLDANGIVVWDNTIGGASNDFLYSVQQTTDGGYILGGVSSSIISGDKTEDKIGKEDYWIIKTDANGVIQWQNVIGGSDAEESCRVTQCSDGSYIVGGTSWSNISGDKSENSIGINDFWLVKINALGVVQWENTIGGNYYEYLGDVQQAADGGFIIGGTSGSGISGDKSEGIIDGSSFGWDYWVIKTDAAGVIEWENTIGGTNWDYLESLVSTSDGGYMLGGTSVSGISGDKTENGVASSYDYWVIKLKGSGPCPPPYENLKATNITTTTARLNWDIRSCADDGYKVQYRKLGVSNWITKYVSTNTGFRNITGLSASTIYEWRVSARCDTAGNSLSAYSAINTFTTASPRFASDKAVDYSVNIYPNPSSSVFNIEINVEQEMPLNIQIFSSFGDRVTTLVKNAVVATGVQRYEFDASSLAAGVYYCRVANGNKTSFHKIMLLK